MQLWFGEPTQIYIHSRHWIVSNVQDKIINSSEFFPHGNALLNN